MQEGIVFSASSQCFDVGIGFKLEGFDMVSTVLYTGTIRHLGSSDGSTVTALWKKHLK